MALACLISYTVITALSGVAVESHVDLVGGMWAAVSTAFVFRDTRQRSLSAGAGRLIASCVSIALCLPYLWYFPANVLGMAILLAAGTLLMLVLGRREDIITTAVTTIVVMVVALKSPANAWEQPLLRLSDTVVGVAMGVEESGSPHLHSTKQEANPFSDKSSRICLADRSVRDD
jgi:uncharacterized membrane protein YccC